MLTLKNMRSYRIIMQMINSWDSLNNFTFLSSFSDFFLIKTVFRRFWILMSDFFHPFEPFFIRQKISSHSEIFTVDEGRERRRRINMINIHKLFIYFCQFFALLSTRSNLFTPEHSQRAVWFKNKKVFSSRMQKEESNKGEWKHNKCGRIFDCHEKFTSVSKLSAFQEFKEFSTFHRRKHWPSFHREFVIRHRDSKVFRREN
jgi:hypothetical protein